MPNGDTNSSGVYNQDWCTERHTKLDKRLDSIETKFWGIILLLLANLSGVATMLMKGLL